MTPAVLRWLVVLIALSFVPGCHDLYRSKPWLSYETDVGFLSAPYLSRYHGGDGVDDCLPGELELDLSMMWRSDVSGDFSFHYRNVTRCSPADGQNYFVPKSIETVLTRNDDILGCIFYGDFESRLVGRRAFFAGQCKDGSQSVFALERMSPGMWSPSLITKTGQTVDSRPYHSGLGMDARFDKANQRFVLAYTDDLNAARLAIFEEDGGGWTGRDAFGPGDITDAFDFSAPRLGGTSSNAFVTFLSSKVMFGPATDLRFSWIETEMSAERITGVGDPVPGLSGESVGSFGNFLFFQNGEDRGAAVVATTPSNFSVALEWDVTDSLSLSLRYKTDDPVPDTLEHASQFFYPAYDGKRLGLMAQTNTFQLAYVLETPNGLGGTIAAGFARTFTDMYFERHLTNLSASNHALVDGVAAYWGGLAPAQGIFLQDVERVEVLRGGPASLYGNQAVVGVVNFGTGPATGFDRVDKGSMASNYGGATFRGRDFLLGNTAGGIYKWNETLGQEEHLGTSGISEGITGLGVDGQGALFASSPSAFYAIDPENAYMATRLGYFRNEFDDPIPDVSDIHFGDETLFAARRNGEIGEVDPETIIFTPRYRIPGLSGDLESITSDGERIFAGLSDGHLVEFLDCPPPLALGFAVAPEVEEYQFGVIGRSGTEAITALVMPEPSSTILGLAALTALGALAGRRARSRADSGR